MLNEEIVEQLSERLVRRIEEANTYVLEQIGKSIKKIGTLTPTKARQLEMILKYGGDYELITQKLAEVTKLNIKDIYKIYEEVAKRDYEFKKYLYDYRKKRFIPYKDNIALQDQVNALAEITAKEYANLTNTSMLGFSVKGLKGRTIFKGLRQTYIDTIDRAILSISQGKSTFDNEMYRVLKELGSSGLKIAYSGKSMRLDSAVRMNFRAGLRDLRNQTQLFYGQEFGANMIEVSHHLNSAPDHIDTVDGKQFAMIDEIKKQIANGTETKIKYEDIEDNRVRVNGKWYYDYNYINSKLQRPVSTLNCYHYTFVGILGLSKPAYTKKQLEEDKQKNEKGFMFEGKHYTLYEGQELQRKIELELRKAKDEQILGRTSNNIELIDSSQRRIRELTTKYHKLIKESGLYSQLEKARVVGFRFVKVPKM